MSRTERLLAIIQTMRSRRMPVTAAALSVEFGVSERTIYRDVAVLVAQGALIDGAAGLGYVLRPGNFLPPLTFGGDEADAIMLGLRYVMRRGDNRLSAAASDALAKLLEVMPHDEAAQARLNGLVVAPLPHVRTEMTEVIRTALRGGRKLTFSYTDEGRRSSQRVVWPIVLGFFEGVTVLAGWCEKREAFRHFRIDRMQNAKVGSERIPIGRPALLARYREVEPDVQH